MSASSVSRWEDTELYSPAAIDIAPATIDATPAMIRAFRSLLAAATPMRRLDVETTPSWAPSTAARSHPIRLVLWISPWSLLGTVSSLPDAAVSSAPGGKQRVGPPV